MVAEADTLPPLWPSTVLFGCRPLVPLRDGAPCPVCGWRELDADGTVVALHPGILPGDERTICGVCHRMSPQNERRIARGSAYRDGLGEGVVELGDLVVAEKGIALTETERRHFWNGYQGHTDADGRPAEVADEHATDRALAGRTWLRRIRQKPDWSIDLDSRGKPVGRLDVEAPAAAPA
jgi:hypothetical protein